MATLYVERVPEELYKALRQRARRSRRSIAAETLTILEQMIPTGKELERRRAFYDRLQRIRRRASPAGPGPSIEQLLREDRER